ncbi:hypothetical protein L6164_001663 [Bauhinia variegata]|uniref:Uncharacterized protein n=1 Tax=Bauhinia variegata TaxID=167791 RepID=A0ACB9QAC0_BAUVA|nr:hypothetical protein L6164_001663 [Bauhinia variegata]
MEDMKESPFHSVPCFLRGLEILLVDHESVSRNYLSSLLEEYSFRVTATNLASMAQSMISNQERRFKIVIAKVGMPDTDILSFQNFLLEKDIPVIFITSGGYHDVMQKALAQGSCYFLQEPIHSRDLKYVWQHAYFTKNHLISKSKGANKVHGAKTRRKTPEEEGNQNQKRVKVSSEQISSHSNHHTANQDEVIIIGEYNNHSNHLTQAQASSHLQKSQSQSTSIQTGFNNQLPQETQQLNFSTEFPSESDFQFSLSESTSEGSSSFKIGSPASTDSLNDDENQDQFPTKFTKSQWQQFLQQQQTSGHATFQNELTTGLTNNGSQGLTAVVGLPTTAASVDPHQSMTELDGNLNPDAEVRNPLAAAKMDQNQSHMVYDHISTLDAMGGNHVEATANNQNPSHMAYNNQNQSQNQPQMLYDSIPTLDAICEKHVPATASYQNQSQRVYDPISNIDEIFGNHVSTAAIDQNQSHKAYDPISTLDAICGNHVLDAAIDQHQSHDKVYDPVSTLDAMCGNHVPTAATHQNQSHDRISAVDAIYGNHVPAATVDQNQSQKVYDPISTEDSICGNHELAAIMDQNESQSVFDDPAILDTLLEGLTQQLQSPILNDGILSPGTAVGNHVPAATEDQNQSQTVYDDPASPDSEIESLMQIILSPTLYDNSLYMAQDDSDNGSAPAATWH